MTQLGEWIVPAIGLAAFLTWVVVIRRALRAARPARPVPDAHIIALATITVVAFCVLLSSLTFPSLIGPDLSRGMVIVARLALLIGGIAVLWTGRQKEVA